MRGLVKGSAILLATLAVGAGPARAENGTGLYAPFPSPSGGARAERFAGELGVDVDAEQIAQGGIVGEGSVLRLHELGVGPAAQRAGADGGGQRGLLVGAGLAMAAAGAAAVLGRRRAR